MHYIPSYGTPILCNKFQLCISVFLRYSILKIFPSNNCYLALLDNNNHNTNNNNDNNDDDNNSENNNYNVILSGRTVGNKGQVLYVRFEYYITTTHRTNRNHNIPAVANSAGLAAIVVDACIRRLLLVHGWKQTGCTRGGMDDLILSLQQSADCQFGSISLAPTVSHPFSSQLCSLKYKSFPLFMFSFWEKVKLGSLWSPLFCIVTTNHTAVSVRRYVELMQRAWYTLHKVESETLQCAQSVVKR